LFINGLDGRELTSDEQAELEEYQHKLVTFRQELVSPNTYNNDAVLDGDQEDQGNREMI
jgi:hypothetical protein